MSKPARTRPNRESEAEDRNSTDGSESPWPKRGLAGKVSSAVEHAPENATDIQILSVGWVAWKEQRDVKDAWREVSQ